jgi:putative DNA methylase
MQDLGDLFNDRQKLALIVFVEKIRMAHEKMLKEHLNPELAKVVSTYLAFALDKLANKNSNQVTYNVIGQTIRDTFARVTLIPITWGYAEINPLVGVGWPKMLASIIQSVEACSEVSTKPAHIQQGTAENLPFPDDYFDAVTTDPPYYDSVPYSDLSDFFYVWLKRSVGHLYPELFNTPLTPKKSEIIQNTSMIRRGSLLKTDTSSRIKTDQDFEHQITKAFSEITRVLRKDGLAVIVFAHKSTRAWETILNSILTSGLVLTASWPLHTEKQGSLRAYESATLASSIFMICRKRVKSESAYYNELKPVIEHRIKERLDHFWAENIRGADFFISAIGPAVEVFGQYAKVEKLSGEPVSVSELLEFTQEVVSNFALQRILKSADLGGVDSGSRLYILWRWVFDNSAVPFDEARKLAQAIGVEITDLWTGGFVKKDKDLVHVIDAIERKKDLSFLKKERFDLMVDALHYSLILWEKGKRSEIKKLLDESGFSSNQTFWQFIQAVSDVLPDGDKEKQMIQGFLTGKKTLTTMAEKTVTLMDYGE